MIPQSYIENWRTQVPWQTLAMVEQDMVISRALIDLFNQPQVFHKYCKNDGIAITKDVFHTNMVQKRLNTDFQVDMSVLLPHQTHWNFDEAFEFVLKHVVSRIDIWVLALNA